MSHLRLQRVWSGRLKDVSAELESGVHVVLGAESDGTGELVELCAGVRAPRRGTVELEGVAPSRSPACRRGIASLLPAEDGMGGGHVESWLAELGVRLGFTPGSVLALAQLEPQRTLASLSASERRRLACGVALGRDNPAFVALHEPLSAVTPDARAQVLARIAQLGRQRVVLVTTASQTEARQLGGTTLRLDRGLLVAAPGGAWSGAAAPGLGVWLEVEADAPRALIAALAQHPDVLELNYGDTRAGRLLVRGSELEPLAALVARAAVNARVDIRLLRSRPDDLESARSAATGLAHAAYRAAQAQARPRVVGPSSLGSTPAAVVPTPPAPAAVPSPPPGAPPSDRSA